MEAVRQTSWRAPYGRIRAVQESDVVELEVGPEPAERAAAWIARRLRDAARRRGSATLAVSGGSTSPPLFESLLERDVPWDLLDVWQVDERVAPDGHDARNAGQLDGLAERSRVRPMPVGSTDLRAAARRYATSLPKRFDIVHLGLGADGHTASWPPGHPEVLDSDRAVELVDLFNGWPRMTLTRRVVNDARARLVLATGASKRPMVERWLLDDRSIPISAIRRSQTRVVLDDDAAPTVTDDLGVWNSRGGR